jgi:hypothetical protein
MKNNNNINNNNDNKTIAIEFLKQIILNSIKIFFEALYENEENLNENENENQNENLNFKEFEFYSKNIFNFFKGKSLLINSYSISEFFFFKFFKFIENYFKIFDESNFGENLFIDYLNKGLENNNFFYLNFIDEFFYNEYFKVMKICDSYRVYFNEYGLEIILTKDKNKKGKKFDIINENLELNPIQCN